MPPSTSVLLPRSVGVVGRRAWMAGSWWLVTAPLGWEGLILGLFCWEDGRHLLCLDPSWPSLHFILGAGLPDQELGDQRDRIEFCRVKQWGPQGTIGLMQRETVFLLVFAKEGLDVAGTTKAAPLEMPGPREPGLQGVRELGVQ